ncbi:MAG: SARP family transcriptional regulator [Streptomycetaceae bacterium]|nr:SARP family transcriptional regulator [Streptomycetaceae bacterium]
MDRKCQPKKGGSKKGGVAVGRRTCQSLSPRSDSPPATTERKSEVRLSVLGGFELVVDGEVVNIPGGSERVLAFVALCCRAAVPRALVAGALWPEAPERCACTNLRSALSRLRSLGRVALDVGPDEVRLAQEVHVDLRYARDFAHRVLDLSAPSLAKELGPGTAAVEKLSADVLPGWYDDWALLAAEDWRQLRMHALDALADDFLSAERFAEAVAAAQAAVRSDPLRESSQACLIRAHLAEGNLCEARHDFTRYEQRLREEAGLRPTPRLCQLVAGLLPSSDRDRCFR